MRCVMTAPMRRLVGRNMFSFSIGKAPEFPLWGAVFRFRRNYSTAEDITISDEKKEHRRHGRLSNRDQLRRKVVLWKHTKKCIVCQKEIMKYTAEPIEESCPQLWRIHSDFVSSLTSCGLYGSARIEKLRNLPFCAKRTDDLKVNRTVS